MKRAITLLTLALAVPCLMGGVRPLALKDLCRNSTRVVRGLVSAEQVRWEGTTIVTDWTITPVENLKGTGVVPFTVKVPGGTIGGLTMRTSEAPRLAVGEDVVLFLKSGTARCDVYGWYQGKYTVVGNLVREKQGTTIEQFLGSIRSELKASEKDK